MHAVATILVSGLWAKFPSSLSVKGVIPMRVMDLCNLSEISPCLNSIQTPLLPQIPYCAHSQVNSDTGVVPLPISLTPLTGTMESLLLLPKFDFAFPGVAPPSSHPCTLFSVHQVSNLARLATSLSQFFCLGLCPQQFLMLAML